MRFVKCDGCPCLNSDYESGSSCNLGYDTKYVKYEENGKIDWDDFSHNCQLTEVIAQDRRVKPRRIPAEDFEAMKVPKEEQHGSIIMPLYEASEEELKRRALAKDIYTGEEWERKFLR